MNNIKYLYLNYEKYSKMFEYDENNLENKDNFNKLYLKEDKNDTKIKSNLEFTKIYYEKNRILLNRFTQEFHEEINVKKKLLNFKFLFFIFYFRIINMISLN